VFQNLPPLRGFKGRRQIPGGACTFIFDMNGKARTTAVSTHNIEDMRNNLDYCILFGFRSIYGRLLGSTSVTLPTRCLRPLVL
jgi:hypothetical protein